MQEVRQTIETYLSTLDKSCAVEVAFFGGSFTGIDPELQNKYLQTVQPYIESGRVSSIRMSTRPDYIDEKILDNLKKYGVKDIELGAQSLDDEVLRFSERGHRAEDVERASKLINDYGYNLGLQMMIGLPMDSKEKSIETAKKIVELGAKTTRIYPTLVIDHTSLASLYREGKYKPLSVEEAIDWTKDIYKIFINSSVKILRVGLHPSRDILSGKGFLAGPFHVSFMELVLTELWKEKLSVIDCSVSEIYVNKQDINYVIGYNSSNRKILQEKNPKIKIVQREDIERGSFRCG